MKINVEVNAVETYNKTGRVPCLKCGMNLVESRVAKIYCYDNLCKGIVITKEMLEIWAAEQGVKLKFNTEVSSRGYTGGMGGYVRERKTIYKRGAPSNPK